MKKNILTLNLEYLKQGKSLSWLSLKTKVSIDKLKKIQSNNKKSIDFEDLHKIIDRLELKDLNELFIIKEIEVKK